jgi:hypothetical protein
MRIRAEREQRSCRGDARLVTAPASGLHARLEMIDPRGDDEVLVVSPYLHALAPEEVPAFVAAAREPLRT